MLVYDGSINFLKKDGFVFLKSYRKDLMDNVQEKLLDNNYLSIVFDFNNFYQMVLHEDVFNIIFKK